MRAWLSLLLLPMLATPLSAQPSALIESVNQRDEECWQMAMKIWGWAEPGYQETKSSQLLADYLQSHGFKVERGVASIPTAFTATFGSGDPVIGILGEYDALPGLAQTAEPERELRDGTNGYGHGCGHHLFGVASASASVAIAQQIKQGKLKGTVRFYGCPAEEGGSAKVFMVQAGLFKDCAAVLHWHPSASNAAGDRTSLARIAVKFRFHGKSAHAAGAPHEGRSALDAVELTNHAAELLREHTPEETRIHHVITAGGSAPNVVPDFAEVYYYVRHPDGHVVKDLYRRLELCAKAGALATETRLEIIYEGGILNLLPNNTLARLTLRILQEQNDLKLPPEELPFATRIHRTLSEPTEFSTVEKVYDRSGSVGSGSTDVGDVSWVVPTTGFNTACWVPGTPGHSWQAVACGTTPLARRGTNLAARVLALSAWELYLNPALLEQARQELRGKLETRKYESLMRPGQKPPLEYRNPPKQ